MNKLITFASLAAVGALSLQGQAVDGSGRPWSVSAKLRGFYDDNYRTTPSDLTPEAREYLGDVDEESWGINFAPGIKYVLLRDQTTLTASLDYDMRWYEAQPSSKEFDHTVRAEIAASHAFSERFRLDFFESPVYSEEPSILEPNGGQASYVRTDGNAWRNYAGIGLTTGLTEQLGSRLGYSNTYYNYRDDGPASISALLDRMEHLATADLRWQFQPAIIGLVGYQYGYFDYTSGDQLWYTETPDPTVPESDARNQESHYGFLGVDYTALPGLTAQIRAGVNYARYPNADVDNVTAPFVDAALAYEYMEGSKVSAGVKHDLRPTDVAIAASDDMSSFTVSQEATTVYAFIAHRIFPKLVGTLRGSWQNGTYNEGMYDGDSDNFYTVDVNLAYEITANFAAEAGYAYDKLDSDIPLREYDRNRFYVGVKATY
ncbi:MAG TPA: outer membrane beta-barrel protein [Candidatus Paceibacterota bacterium]|nr:outer membrane beta-barrel protein [Candidatus Paceibacterota bacterium]